jgi:hypothetical protein
MTQLIKEGLGYLLAQKSTYLPDRPTLDWEYLGITVL